MSRAFLGSLSFPIYRCPFLGSQFFLICPFLGSLSFLPSLFGVPYPPLFGIPTYQEVHRVEEAQNSESVGGNVEAMAMAAWRQVFPRPSELKLASLRIGGPYLSLSGKRCGDRSHSLGGEWTNLDAAVRPELDLPIQKRCSLVVICVEVFFRFLQVFTCFVSVVTGCRCSICVHVKRLIHLIGFRCAYRFYKSVCSFCIYL